LSVDYIKEGKVATFKLNSPQTMNALDLTALNEFYLALRDFHDDDNLWIGIITGTGEEAFCSGINIDLTLNKGHNSQPLPPTLMKGLEIAKPLIASVNGLALGGGFEIVLACDIRIASDNATFGMPEVKLGYLPNWGGTQRLARQISFCHAAEILLTGNTFDAHEAYRMGLINRVVTKDKLASNVKEWAADICNVAPLAVRAIKEAMIKGADISFVEALNLESALATYLSNTEDFHEGIKAFQEKRKPHFKAC
jgi:enoyl-CoA hydratase/carnithine racemase